MKKSSLFITAGAFLGGLMVFTNCAVAQGASSMNEQVIVVAPYITHETQTTMSGARNKGVYDVHTLTKNVSYADLDLSKSAGANEFAQRINDTAKESCDKLKAQFRDPPHAPVTTDQECVKRASDQAMVVANLLIDGARVAVEMPATAPPASMAEATSEPAPVEAEATTVPRKQDRH